MNKASEMPVPHENVSLPKLDAASMQPENLHTHTYKCLRNVGVHRSHGILLHAAQPPSPGRQQPGNHAGSLRLLASQLPVQPMKNGMRAPKLNQVLKGLLVTLFLIQVRMLVAILAIWARAASVYNNGFYTNSPFSTATTACCSLSRAVKHTEGLAPVHGESIMKVCTVFPCAMILLSGIAANVHHMKSFLNHTAFLPCSFPNPQNTDLQDLRIFWQKGAEVVNEVYHGQEKLDNLHPKYINRTKMDTGRWTLQLLNAGIVDEGEYTCIVQHTEKGAPKLIHKYECLLHII
ncbi:uncharacterized protein, partial [Melanerpes formicivorus]|uniref:uncharacterized protein n=1 Tax=Melanerpes formicivorus TaxID=211600 RepID=UPI00358DFF8E